MKMRFIGDVHGKYGRYKKIIKEVENSVQVGDMGVGFFRIFGDEKIPYKNPPYDAMSKGNHYFIRGNHDNPEVCKKHDFWIPDGTLLDGVFYLGGATSIDRKYRTEGLDWWPNEECSWEQLEEAIDIYSDVKPEIVVTHEAPESVATEILQAFNLPKINDFSRTREALERMMYIHQPRIWIHGHWHCSLNYIRGKTNFICLNELEYTDLEI